MAGWADNFSYDYYGRLVEAACRFLTPRLFREVPSLRAEGGNLLLRHDIDCSLDAALALGRLERDMGVRSTYFVMMQSLLYDPEQGDVLHELRDLGHEVGIHFDCPPEQRGDDRAGLEARVRMDCHRLQAVLGEAVTSISFHRPVESFLRGPLFVAGRVNAYAAELMTWYISDSRGSWRCGEPLAEIARARHGTLQLLTHPIWWGREHLAPADRLQLFFRQSTRHMSRRERAVFDAILTATMPGVRRNGLYEPPPSLLRQQPPTPREADRSGLAQRL